jgi:hypothetical protein
VILPEKIVTHRNVDVIFELANAKGKPLHDLEPLMRTDGRCVIIIISSDAKEFLHVHLVEGVDPELRGDRYSSLHDKLSKAGSIQNMRTTPAQGKYNNRVLLYCQDS